MRALAALGVALLAAHASAQTTASASPPPLLAPGAGLYTPSSDASELCSYVHAPADGSAPLTWRLNRGGGTHGLGLVAPKGFYRVDVGAGEKATSFFFQFCGSMAFTPASPPPACTEAGADACPAACASAPGHVCGSSCASMVSQPPGASDGRCHALARASGNVTVAPLNASRPADGLAFTFSAGDSASCTSPAGRTLRVAVRCAAGGPLAPALLPASVSPAASDKGEDSCAWETAMSHPAGCPLPLPGSAPPDASAAPLLYWAKERRYIERHVGADEVFEHFSLSLRNDGGGALLASLFALQNANFIRFNPPALTLAPGESGVVDVKVPSRFVYDSAEIKIQTNGGEGDFFLIRDDWPTQRHPELAPRSRRHTQLVALGALAAVFAVCSAGRGGAQRARAARAEAARLQLGRHRPLAEPRDDAAGGGSGALNGEGSDDEGEGGLTGRRCTHYRRRDAAAAAAAAADADAELAAAYAASEAGGAGGGDDAAWLLCAEERAAAKAAALAASAAEMGAERIADDSGGCGDEAADDAGEPLSPLPSSGDGLAAAERQLLCVICLAAPKCVALIPCRHLSTCLACTRRLTAATTLRCPLCRRPATDFVQLFL